MTIIPAICSSLFEVCATQPIDVIKTHYQTNTKVLYTFKNLYSGFIPRACGNIPSRTIFLYSQDFFQTFYTDKNFDVYPLIGLEKDKKDKGVLNEIGVKTPINHLTDIYYILFIIYYLLFLQENSKKI